MKPIDIVAVMHHMEHSRQMEDNSRYNRDTCFYLMFISALFSTGFVLIYFFDVPVKFFI
jgi:hypothetical protein